MTWFRVRGPSDSVEQLASALAALPPMTRRGLNIWVGENLSIWTSSRTVIEVNPATGMLRWCYAGFTGTAWTECALERDLRRPNVHEGFALMMRARRAGT